MKVAHYLKFRKGEGGSVGKIGGDPTILPSVLPWPPADTEYLAFVLELKVDGKILPVPNASFIQLYQPIDEGDDPLPIAAVIKAGDEGGKLVVNRHPSVTPFAIDAEITDEPDELPAANPTLEYGEFLKSKLGGNDPWNGDEGRLFLGQISEMPAGLNFGGTTCSLYLCEDGSVVTELH